MILLYSSLMIFTLFSKFQVFNIFFHHFPLNKIITIFEKKNMTKGCDDNIWSVLPNCLCVDITSTL